jgi:hypothetical protein
MSASLVEGVIYKVRNVMKLSWLDIIIIIISYSDTLRFQVLNTPLICTDL